MAAQTQLKAQMEELRDWLSFEELRVLGEESNRLFANALALAKARCTPMLVGVSPSPAAGADDAVTGESAEQPTGVDVEDA